AWKELRQLCDGAGDPKCSFDAVIREIAGRTGLHHRLAQGPFELQEISLYRAAQQADALVAADHTAEFERFLQAGMRAADAATWRAQLQPTDGLTALLIEHRERRPGFHIGAALADMLEGLSRDTLRDGT